MCSLCIGWARAHTEFGFGRCGAGFAVYDHRDCGREEKESNTLFALVLREDSAYLSRIAGMEILNKIAVVRHEQDSRGNVLQVCQPSVCTRARRIRGRHPFYE